MDDSGDAFGMMSSGVKVFSARPPGDSASVSTALLRQVHDAGHALIVQADSVAERACRMSDSVSLIGRTEDHHGASAS